MRDEGHKRGRGRPKGSGRGYSDGGRRVTVRLNDQESAALDKLARTLGLAPVVVIRQLITTARAAELD